MHTAWTKGTSGKEKEERKAQVLSYTNAFEDLSEVIEASFKKKESCREYDQDWQAKQIAINEYNAAIKDILKFINLKPKGK